MQKYVILTTAVIKMYAGEAVAHLFAGKNHGATHHLILINGNINVVIVHGIALYVGNVWIFVTPKQGKKLAKL